MIKEFIRDLFSSKKKAVNRTPRIVPRDEHGIDRRKVSLEAIRTVENIQRAGFEADVVGGAARDLWLGVTPKDSDLVTSATPEQDKR